jgi:hypothetical protein
MARDRIRFAGQSRRPQHLRQRGEKAVTGRRLNWGEHMDELQLLRDAKIALKREHSHIIQLCKQEIYDRCGYDLACELVAQKSGLPEPIVRSIARERNVQ